MEKNIENKNIPPKAVTPRTEEERRKRRQAWMCGILAFLNLIALALLILLPFNCKGSHHHHNDDDTDTTVVIDSTIHVRDTTRVVEEEEDVSDEMDREVGDRGGDVDAFMRFTIMWNENGRDIVDLDAHAEEPSGAHIYFHSYRYPQRTRCGGQLDVDMQSPRTKGVENISWPSANQLMDGDYEFGIHNFDNGRFGECNVKLIVGNKSFIYKVGHFNNSHPRSETIYPDDIKPIAVVTIKNHQVENIRHIQRPVSE